MKQLKWVWILGIAAVLLTVIFLVLDHRSRENAEKLRVGAPKQLLLIDSTDVSRITIDNPEGHYAFDWDSSANTWVIASSERFNLNPYAIATICNYITDLKSQKTVAFDCQDTSVYGFDRAVTLKVFTNSGGTENPYVLYVGDPTQTNDAYYAMVENSNDVYTIDYSSGSIFWVAKDTLKNTLLFDLYGSNVTYFRQETEGMLPIEITRSSDGAWTMQQPAPDMALQKASIDNIMETLVRAAVQGFVEENPEDLAKYGLDDPEVKLWVRGTESGRQLSEEIWFGDPISQSQDETKVYGYLVKSKQVFTILRADTQFARTDVMSVLLPYCWDADATEVKSLSIDMGSIYDMNETLFVDLENDEYALGTTDIDALDDANILSLFQAYYRSVSDLAFTALDLEAKPAGEAAITIRYEYKNGETHLLEFVPKEENNFCLVADGVYTGKTVRLNRFTTASGVVPSYEALMNALKKANG